MNMGPQGSLQDPGVFAPTMLELDPEPRAGRFDVAPVLGSWSADRKRSCVFDHLGVYSWVDLRAVAPSVLAGRKSPVRTAAPARARRSSACYT